MAKKGFLFTKPVKLMWRGVGHARMRRGMQGHVPEPLEPTQAPVWRECGADVWQGHASPRGLLGGATWQVCLGAGR